MAKEFRKGLFYDMWADYASGVIPNSAGAAQRLGMKQSFIAGALAYQMAMASAFVSDAQDGNAIANLEILDAEINDMTVEFMHSVTLSALEGKLKPSDGAPVKTGVHVIEARGLTPDEVAELNEMIQQYIAVKTGERNGKQGDA